MAGREYKGKAKIVQKMTRDGLIEENKTEEYDREPPSRAAPFHSEADARSGRTDNRSGRLDGRSRTDDVGDGERESGKRKSQSGKRMPDTGDRISGSGNRMMDSEADLSMEGENSEGTSSGGSDLYRSKRQRLNQMRRYAEIGGGEVIPGKRELYRTDRTDDGILEEIAEGRPGRRSKAKPNGKQAGSSNGDSAGRKAINGPQDQGSAYRNKLKNQESIPRGEGLADSKEEIQKKQQRKRLTEEQKKVSKLLFDDEGGMTQGAGTGIARKSAATTGAAATATALAGKALLSKDKDSDEDDNVAVEAAGDLMDGTTASLRKAQLRSNRTSGRMIRKGYQDVEVSLGGRLKFSEAEGSAEAAKQAARQEIQHREKQRNLSRFLQRKRYRDAYAAAKSGKKTAESVGGFAAANIQEAVAIKAKVVKEEFIRKSSAILITAGLLGILFLVISASLSSCSASIQGAGSLIGTTTYPSTDKDIHDAENAYRALEAALNAQINSVESRNANYDEYRYNVAEIWHNPYHLISYLTVKFGEFKYEDVEPTIRALFAAQYGMDLSGNTETVTETRTVRVGESLGQVVTSGYCNCSICCGQWSGGPTASGVMPQSNHTIAVDANNPTVPMGTKVVMNGVEYVVEDTGAFARYGVDFDVYYDSHAAASAHGHKTWEAYLADDNGSREIEVTHTETRRILSVTLTNVNLDTILWENMDEEERILYDALNNTYGNRNYLFDINSIGPGGDGMSYAIPPEALTDERFRRMIREAEKYLGYPYVWGGSSPATSFDCSGFVSWVINNCGNGWSYGRLTADGLRGICTYVSPAQAKPGDLIFFQGTYATTGASHVGIYVGNNMMIHCGDPIHYSSIATSYWQQHFLCFGRLP